MKKSTKIFLPFLVIVLLFGLVFASCVKDRVELENFQPMDEFYDEHRQEEQVFVIDTSGTGPIVGKEGSELYVGKDLFMLPNGDSVTWPYTVKLIELYPPKDMILWEMPTVGGGNVLQTGGELKVTAFKGNEELILRPSALLHIKTAPAGVSLLNNMEVFYGFGPEENELDWTNDATTLAGYINGSDISSAGKDTGSINYYMNISHMGWINCDKIYPATGAPVEVTFTVEGNGTEFIDIYFVFNDIRSVVKIYNLKSGHLPNGEKAKVIAMVKNEDGEFLLHQENITVTYGQEIALDFKTVTEDELLSVLEAL